MIRRAEPGEEARLVAFLARHPDTSMFLRSNLQHHGLGPSDHTHATSYWLAETEAGNIRAVAGCTNGGFLMAQVPEPVVGFWEAVAVALAKRRIVGMTGEDGQVEAALEGIGLAGAVFTLNHAEPLYRLELAGLDDPCADLRAAEPGDEAMLLRWFAEHLIDTGMAGDTRQAIVDARRRATQSVADGNLRIMSEGGVPVAMAAINARAGDMVQVGSVHVLREHRNAGLGRRVTAALLAEARAAGAATAVLFANNAAAARAYEAISFRRVGRFRIALLARPQPVRVMA